MNRYEQQAMRQRKAAVRSSVTLWTACAALVVVIFAIIGLSMSAPPQFWYRGALGVAILLLIFRQISRRLKATSPRAAEPDPQSRLNLD